MNKPIQFFQRNTTGALCALALLLICSFPTCVFAQGTAINNSGAAPHNSAMLDVSSSSKGILIPRMTEAQREAIGAPAEGLMVYQTDEAEGFWYFDGISWNPVSGGSGPTGSSLGDLQYWTGSEWAIVPVGLPGQTMQISAEGIPGWVGSSFPLLTTASVSSIGGTVAVSGGNISADGGAPVTARGVCWNTSPNPTLAHSYNTSGSGTGAFTTYMPGLQTNTTYYVRAWATSSVGTAYGNQVSFTTNPTASIAIGETYAGGIIFYVDGSGLHGRVISPVDQSSSVQWGCYGTALGGTSVSFGTGQSNTTQVVNSCGTPGIAAKLCNDLVLNGYSDWYMPSRDELNLAYQNLHLN